MCRKNSMLTRFACVLLSALATTNLLADTKEVGMKFSDAGNDDPTYVSVKFTDTAKKDGDAKKTRYVDVLIPANASATIKRDKILAKLREKGYTVVEDGDNGLKFTRLDSKTEVTFGNGGTMENDVVACATPAGASSMFQGFFDPLDKHGQPALFTAGIVTDVGELSTTISAAELNFQTDGPIICQALFQRLAPRAPQYGAQINYAGDRLEVYFDPAFTVTQGGVIWGTNSPSEGCGGSIVLEYPEMQLSIDNLVAGQRATFTAAGAQPSATVFFYYALQTGDTYIPNLDVTLDLRNPVLIASASADRAGIATVDRSVPRNARNLNVSFQAAAFRDISQVETQRVR